MRTSTITRNPPQQSGTGLTYAFSVGDKVYKGVDYLSVYIVKELCPYIDNDGPCYILSPPGETKHSLSMHALEANLTLAPVLATTIFKAPQNFSWKDFFLSRKKVYSAKMAAWDKKYPTKADALATGVDDIEAHYKIGSRVEWRDLPDEANLVSSMTNTGEPHKGFHAIAVDIDHQCHLLPSRTPVHFHLYVDKKIPWKQYIEWLRISAEIGIVEEGFYRACLAKGMSTLRMGPYEEYKEYIEERMKNEG